MKKYWDKAISFDEYFKKTEEIVKKKRRRTYRRRKKNVEILSIRRSKNEPND